MSPHVPVRPFGVHIDRETQNQIFDGKFLYWIVQKWDALQAKKNGLTTPDSKLLPGAFAQNVVFAVRDDYQNYFKALRAFREKPGVFTGRPKEPKYPAKNGRKTMEVDMAQIHGKLISLKNADFYLDYGRTRPLPQAAIDAYRAVDVHAWIAQIKAKNALCEASCAEQIRIVPVGQSAKVEIVFSVPVEIADNSLIGKLMQYARDQDWDNKKNSDFLAVLGSHPEAIKKQASTLCKAEKLNMAGADLGMTNLVSIGYHTIKKETGLVVTGQQFGERIVRMDRRLEQIQSALTPQAVKTIQQRQEQGENISKEDRNLLSLAYQNLYANADYLEALAHKTAFVNDTVHKLTSQIVENLTSRNVQMLVVGKNVGWKTAVNMGRTKNRAFHNFPHARFIDVLRYKAFAAGILVVTTEEAYTSKSSFIKGGILPAHGESKAILAQANAAPSTPVASPSTAPSITLKTLLGGTRGTKLKRHFYTCRHLGKKFVMHADINGANNILRKVCSWLQFDPDRHALRATIVGMCWGRPIKKRYDQFALICA